MSHKHKHKDCCCEYEYVKKSSCCCNKNCHCNQCCRDRSFLGNDNNFLLPLLLVALFCKK